MFSIIAAHDETYGIGKDNALPWNVPEDLAMFKKLTLNSTVIMGRKTFDSIGRPLPSRENIIITSSTEYEQLSHIVVATSFEEALSKSSRKSIFIIGGSRVFAEALKHPGLQKIYLTKIQGSYDCDVFFPKMPPSTLESTEILSEKAELQVHSLIKPNVDEMQYLNLVKSILDSGEERDDRTGVGTKSIFGAQMRFNLREFFPLLTTKRVFWRGVVEELLWFISGDTSAKTLQDKKVHIWDGNSTRDFLDSRGLHDYPEGELGPVYGYQWRCYDGDYPTRNNGIDQLQEVIRLIKEEPNSRRIILNAWNPKHLDAMALPPCHVLYQFYVGKDKTLSCSMYQRSGDIGLGIPFNIASASLLTHILAIHCDLTPGYFIHSIGDCHIYLNHITALSEQVQRKPSQFPKLSIKVKRDSITDYTIDDFELIGYRPQKTIKMEMTV
jgi:dihydrofolate reductase/thymidylate synthase